MSTRAIGSHPPSGHEAGRPAANAARGRPNPAARIGGAALLAALLVLALPGAAQGATEGLFSNNFFGNGAGEEIKLMNTRGDFSFGGRNSLFGSDAGRDTTTGERNSFFGAGAGRFNTSGARNAFFGDSAGNATTTGADNALFGYQAGSASTTATDNAFFGAQAGLNNTASGNSFFGRAAGFSNTTGTGNSYFGRQAGEANRTGADNAFFGSRAGQKTADVPFNAFFGSQAGQNNLTGAANAFFGYQAGLNNFNGTRNVLLGGLAGVNNISGSDNVFIGVRAGESNTTGSGNTALGQLADGAAGITRATAIGQRAKVTQSDSLVLGAIEGLNGAVADTRVGIGSPSPEAPLHVRSAQANELLLLDQGTGGPSQLRSLIRLSNKGGSRVQFENVQTSSRYQAGTGDRNFVVDNLNTGQIEMKLGRTGDLAITGALSQNANRNGMRRVDPVPETELLELLEDLEIYEWTYKGDPGGARHIGPMAQDFHAAFGLGSKERQVAPSDLAGVALAGVQAVEAENEDLRARVEALEDQVGSGGG